MFTVNKCAFAAKRVAETSRETIIDPARLAKAAAGPCDNDPERWFAVREIVRAVERINDPAIGGKPIHYACVGMRGFLANDVQGAVDRGESFAEHFLGFAVSDSYKVVG